MKKRIAVILNAWSNEFIQTTIEGIRKGATEDGVDVFIYATYVHVFDDSKQNMCQLNLLHLGDPKDFDGAIILTNTFNISEELDRVRSIWINSGIPIITTEVYIDDVPCLRTDNVSGMRELVEHLVNVHNVKDVVYVEGIRDNQENVIRRNTIEETLAKYNLEVREHLYGDFGSYRAASLIREWIALKKPMPDAFICANDYTAIAISNILNTSGTRVPEDVIVTGFDNIICAKNGFPMLASVSREWDTLGYEAYTKLMKMAKGEHIERDIQFDTRFVPNESCGCDPGEERCKERINYIRNAANDFANENIFELFFQDMRTILSTYKTKEEMLQSIARKIEQIDIFGKNFCFCVRPDFFTDEDENMLSRIRGYGDDLRVVFDNIDGTVFQPYSFNGDEIVPGYIHDDNDPQTFILFPLNHCDSIIGYGVIKNDLTLLYNLRLKKFMTNINMCFLQSRQYESLQAANKQLKEKSRRDFLSGLYNRAGCDEMIFDYIAFRGRSELKTVFLFVDIDRMKIINDKYGHLNGDLAIKATADALQTVLGERFIIGRYGGDEFIAAGAYEEGTDMEDFRDMLNLNIRRYINKLNLSFRLSASVGYTVIMPTEHGNIEQYINRADESMYEQKERAHREIDAMEEM